VNTLDVSTRKLELRLTNVWALDQAAALSKQDWKRPSVRKRFSTRVEFTDVRTATLRLPSALAAPAYMQAELSMNGDLYRIEILLGDRERVGPTGVVKIAFADASVEDIADKVQPLLPPGVDARTILSPIDKAPSFYVSAGAR
jgi:hypothetical protein